MEKRAVLQITNISKLNNLDKNATFDECINCVLSQDFKFNKFIKPDTIELLKSTFESFKINFKDDYFCVNNVNYEISYQLKCGYYILRYLSKFLKGDLNDYFFENSNKYGNVSKNIRVEVTKPGILDNENS